MVTQSSIEVSVYGPVCAGQYAIVWEHIPIGVHQKAIDHGLCSSECRASELGVLNPFISNATWPLPLSLPHGMPTDLVMGST